MIIEIAKNEYYEIFVDTPKNRAYCTVIGRWSDTELVKNYFPDWKRTVTYLKPNFTIFADIRLMGNMSKDIELIHQEIQVYLMEQGMLVTAQLAPADELADYQIYRSTQRSKFAIYKFDSQEEAENFLEESVRQHYIEAQQDSQV